MHKVIIILLILIPVIYANSENCNCHYNRNGNEDGNGNAFNTKIEIINNVNIPLLLKIWIVTGILINYMQTIIYIMNYH
jgi:hypothetical protein